MLDNIFITSFCLIVFVTTTITITIIVAVGRLFGVVSAFLCEAGQPGRRFFCSRGRPRSSKELRDSAQRSRQRLRESSNARPWHVRLFQRRCRKTLLLNGGPQRFSACIRRGSRRREDREGARSSSLRRPSATVSLGGSGPSPHKLERTGSAACNRSLPASRSRRSMAVGSSRGLGPVDLQKSYRDSRGTGFLPSFSLKLSLEL